MKKLFILLVSLLTVTSTVEGISAYRFYKKLVRKEKIGMIREYYMKELQDHPEILETRGDDFIIERCIGKCLNSKGDGEIMGVDGYQFISYRSVKGVRKGDVVMTVFIYPPNSKINDDFERYDFIIDTARKRK